MVSDEELINHLQEVAEELGKTPSVSEMNDCGDWSDSTYHSHFGSWNNALEEAGFERREKDKPSKQKLINHLQELAEDLGKKPAKMEMNDCGEWSGSTYQYHFGSWNNALKEAGFERREAGFQREEKDKLSKQKLINHLQELAEDLGKKPTKMEMNDCGEWSGSTYQNHFGSWNNALEESGFGRREGGFERRQKDKLSKQKLINHLQELAEELNKTPTKIEMDDCGEWSGSTYYSYFGSWNNALKEAGLKENLAHPKKERLVKDLIKLSDKLNKTPTAKEMNKYGDWSVEAYRNNFGTWNNALKNSGLDINTLSSKERAGTGETAYGIGYVRLRERCYSRDNYQCRACGDDNFVHCHHIKPRKKFENVSDSNTLDNVITLCNSCHGKVEGKWQESSPDEFAELAQEEISTRSKHLSIDSNNSEL